MHDPEDGRGPKGEETPDAAARYIASLVDELSQLAKRNGLEALSYILDMARLEATQVSKNSPRVDTYPRSLSRPRSSN
jgi:hypothetical protein